MQGSRRAKFHIDPDGPGFPDSYPAFLYSPAKADMRTTPTFLVRYQRPGQFIVHVNQVSNSATLQISLDGAVAQTFKLDAAPPPNGATPDYKSTEMNDQWKIYQATFDKDYAIDVPAGNHHIDLAVTDGDWMSITSLSTDKLPIEPLCQRVGQRPCHRPRSPRVDAQPRPQLEKRLRQAAGHHNKQPPHHRTRIDAGALPRNMVRHGD